MVPCKNKLKNYLHMKIILIVIIATLIITGCNSNPKVVEKAGADRDKNGCITSAGYTWSTLKNKCVQIFQAGTQFSAYGTNSDSTMTAYVILSDDKSKAEAFLTSRYAKEAIILDAVKFSKKDATFTLYETQAGNGKNRFFKR
jgi:hypothetical protein